MCAAMAGEPSRASSIIDRARGRSGGSDFDLILAEKIVGAGSDTRRAVNLEWDGVDSLNSWRFGMASATGVAIPDRLMQTAGPQMWAWAARAPMVPLDQRTKAADVAASLGVFSGTALVEMYSLLADRTDPSELGGSVAQRLGNAYSGSVENRIAALRDLWDDGDTPANRHARLILTAGAAARLAPSAEREDVAGQIVAAMLTAGMDRRAARWLPAVAGMDGDSGNLAWSLLAVSAPGRLTDMGRLDNVVDADETARKARSRLLVAALAGLGRIDSDTAAGYEDDLAISFRDRNAWTDALESASGRRQRGEVAILAAAGMQTGAWQSVPPGHLYRIVRALRSVGLEYEARMIAAEALYRA